MINVLIIDDMPSSRMVLRMILEENFEDMDITEAASGVEGLEVLESKTINIILSDVDMPEMNGFEFAREINKYSSTKNIPLIFISSHSTEEYINGTETDWGYDILQKPVIKDILVAKIVNYINMHQVIESKANLIDENIVYFETDLEGIMTHVSKAFVTVSGYTKEELIGSSQSILKHPDMDPVVYTKMWETLKSGEKWEGIVTNLKKDGLGSYTLKATSFPLFTHGKISGYASARQDITTQVEANIKFEKILNAQSSIVIITDGEKILEANNSLYDDFGFKGLEDFRSQYNCICEMFIEKDVAHLSQQMGDKTWLEHIKADRTGLHEAYLMDAEGRERVYQVKYRGELEEGGNNIIIFDDVTEMKQQTKTLFKQARFAEMGEMIGMIAHQWRQPLSAMNALMIKLNMKRRLGELQDDDWKESYAKHNELTSYMTTTIDDFKNFFKNNTDVISIKVDEIVAKPYRLVEGLLTKQNVEFSIEYEDEGTQDLMVQISSAKLDQVFLNLYKNALDEFISKDRRDGTIKVSCKRMPKALIFRVCDNAGGIPETVLEKVFDAYFSTKADNGTGIGLYMTKMIVEQHAKGEIIAYNVDGGACFQVSIPIETSDMKKGI